MIKRENKLIITFPTTTAAIAMEQCCKAHGIPGRLIPVPTSISAGCGLAWCSRPEEKAMLLSFMEQNHILPEAVHICCI